MTKRNVEAYKFITDKIIAEEIAKVYHDFEQIESGLVNRVF